MKLAKAIYIKENYLKLHSHELYKEIVEADRLSIEALKYRLELEQTDPEITLEPLPGETED